MTNTPEFDFDDMTANQKQAEVPYNAALLKVEEALGEPLTVLVDNTNAVTLTAAQLRENLFFQLDDDSPVPDAAITITVPDLKRGQFVVFNNTSFTATIEVSGQSAASPVVEAGEIRLFILSDSNVRVSGGGASTFTSLTDTLSSFSGQGGRVIAVNGGETALEAIDVVSTAAGARPPHKGALIKIDSDISAETTLTAIPWESAVYDKRFDPGDGGTTQRFWLGVNRTFVDGDVTVGSDQIGDTAHGFTTGEGPLQLTSSGTLPAGLALTTDYWIIRVDDNTFKFATSRANAIADTDVDITAAAGGGTHTLNTEELLIVPAGVTMVKLLGQIETQTDVTGQIIVSIHKNSAVFDGTGSGGVETTGTEQIGTQSATVEVSEGDNFQLMQFAGDTGTVEADFNRTWFSIEVVETTQEANPPEQVEHYQEATPTVSVVFFSKLAVRRFSMKDDLVGSLGRAVNGPNGGAVAIDVQVEGSSIGTITFADSSGAVQTASFVTAGGAQEDVEIGERLELVAPSDLQSMSKFIISLLAFRT